MRCRLAAEVLFALFLDRAEFHTEAIFALIERAVWGQSWQTTRRRLSVDWQEHLALSLQRRRGLGSKQG